MSIVANMRLGTNGTRYRFPHLAAGLSYIPTLTLHPGIPISHLGAIFAKQTDDRSQCILDRGKEYCTCVFECGNGVWSCKDGKFRFESGCKKYCHAGECDGDGA